MVKALLDTNIQIDFLNGSAAAREEVGRYDDAAISIITWMEVMVGAPDGAADATRAFLEKFSLVEIDGAVAEAAVRRRRAQRIKLPDAIVWASAQMQGRLLVTRNIKDFSADDPGVRVPYPAP